MELVVWAFSASMDGRVAHRSVNNQQISHVVVEEEEKKKTTDWMKPMQMALLISK